MVSSIKIELKPIFLSMLCLFLALCFTCSDDESDSLEQEEPEEVVMDPYVNLTPCLIDLVDNFKDFMLSDEVDYNDDFLLDRILLFEVDSKKYFWLETNAVDEFEYIVNESCEIFCIHHGWTSFDENCLNEFSEEIWALAWEL